MSEQSVQSNGVPVSEQQHDTTAQAVQESAELVAQAAAKVEQEQRKAAESIRQSAVKAYQRGEVGYAAGLLESGRLCGEYVMARLALGDKRKAATTALSDGLTPFASDTPDPNRLIRVYQADLLLGGLSKTPKCPATVYGVYRDHWSRLVERVHEDTPQESYVLLPGLEAECLAAFDKAVKDGLSRDAVKELAGGLVRSYASLQAQERQQAAEAAKAQQQAKAAELSKAAAEMRAAEAKDRDAQAAAKQSTDAAVLNAAIAAAAELEAKQKAAVAAQAVAVQAEKDRKAAEKRAAEDKARTAKAAEVAAKAAEKAKEPAKANPADSRGTVTGNLLKPAVPGTPKDVAEMLEAALLGSGAPVEVLNLLCKRLHWTGALATAIVHGMADNDVDPAKAEAAMGRMATVLAEYGMEGEEEETAAVAA